MRAFLGFSLFVFVSGSVVAQMPFCTKEIGLEGGVKEEIKLFDHMSYIDEIRFDWRTNVNRQQLIAAHLPQRLEPVLAFPEMDEIRFGWRGENNRSGLRYGAVLPEHTYPSWDPR